MPADRDVMRAPKGMLDVLPPDSARWIEVVARFAAPGRTVRLRPAADADRRALRGVRAGRRDHRRRPQGDVRLRRPRRAPARAAARREPRRSCARSCSTGRRRRGRSGTSHRTSGPNSRRPGRYRQHWQLGAEVIGIDDPDVDVEMIELLWGFCRDLGLRDIRLLRQLDGRRARRARATARCCSRTGTRTPT